MFSSVPELHACDGCARGRERLAGDRLSALLPWFRRLRVPGGEPGLAPGRVSMWWHCTHTWCSWVVGAFIHLHLQEHTAFVPYRDIDVRTCIVVYEHNQPAHVQYHEYTKTSVRIETCSYRVYSTYFSCSGMPLYFCLAFKSPAHTESHTKNVCTRHGKHCKPRHRRCAMGSSPAPRARARVHARSMRARRQPYWILCVLRFTRGFMRKSMRARRQTCSILCVLRCTCVVCWALCAINACTQAAVLDFVRAQVHVSCVLGFVRGFMRARRQKCRAWIADLPAV